MFLSIVRYQCGGDERLANGGMLCREPKNMNIISNMVRIQIWMTYFADNQFTGAKEWPREKKDSITGKPRANISVSVAGVVLFSVKFG